MMEEKYYETLGISRNSSENDIKIAYRQLAKKYHPDHNKELNAQEKFIEIKEAYDTLINPKIEDSFLSIFGIEQWDTIIERSDYITRNIIQIDGLYKHALSDYKWACNKMILLNKTYQKFIYELNYLDEISQVELTKEILTEVKEHLIKVVNKEPIERMPKNYINPLDKPIWDDKIAYNGNLDYKRNTQFFNYLHKYNKKVGIYDCIDGFIKKSYNIRNQFHPKFLDKLPMKAQIFIRNKIRDLIRQISI